MGGQTEAAMTGIELIKLGDPFKNVFLEFLLMVTVQN